GLGLLHVGNMDNLSRRNSPARACLRIKGMWAALPEFDECSRGALEGGSVEQLAVVKQQMRKLRCANATGVGKDRIERKFQVTGGSWEDLRYFGVGGLPPERLARVGGARPQLVEQARVLDGNDSLRRKIRQQRDLLIGKPARLVAVDDERAR